MSDRIYMSSPDVGTPKEASVVRAMTHSHILTLRSA